MKITVAGAGLVGLVTSAGLAELGHQVTCIDIQKKKIDLLQNGRTPINEPGLDPLLEKNLNNGNLHFTMSPYQAYSDTEVIFIAVGTKNKHDDSVDLRNIHVVSNTIAHFIENNVVLCIISTVPIGTNDLINKIIDRSKPPNLRCDVVSNPDFLRKGSAINDFFYGERIIIGADNHESASMIKQIYEPLKIPTIITDILSAEMMKYAI
ncbi:UDP-glucose/GDP-mannose dehydrogenase family protein [Neobacillus cucumis]|uniref:nucleotide sugar dehydrogenase n=1 Tax=Neobacillus cucumis TaxID=1740721 RepID=UPI0018DF7C75|nr:nucleotide sugar dehydrogenase [Neobacillus cucumis]MBI0579339.1 UDP-glucose/GDP-mannose dehydrogenase family protein [Neobacillus cucumis]